MSPIETYKDIRMNLTEGCPVEAYQGMLRLDEFQRADMLDYFADDLGDWMLAVKAARTFFRMRGYLGDKLNE